MEYFTLQVETAKKYGVNASIVLHCIIYFVLTNKRANRNKKKGRFWTYNSYEGWVQSLPFFTATQIRGALQKLREQGAVETGRFNKKGYDKRKPPNIGLKEFPNLKKRLRKLTDQYHTRST